MKSLLNGLLLASVLAFTVGCGKDASKSSGGGGVTNAALNPYSGAIPAASQAALKNFQNWYTSTTEGAFPGIGQKTETRTIKTYSQTDGCETKAIDVFGLNLGSFNYCFGSSSPVSTQTAQRTINVVAGQSKASNSKLALAYSGSGLTLASVTQTQSQFGAVYTIEYKKADGHKIIYVVDTGINSAFNPVQITDSGLKTVEIVSQIQ